MKQKWGSYDSQTLTKAQRILPVLTRNNIQYQNHISEASASPQLQGFDSSKFPIQFLAALAALYLHTGLTD